MWMFLANGLIGLGLHRHRLTIGRRTTGVFSQVYNETDGWADAAWVNYVAVQKPGGTKPSLGAHVNAHVFQHFSAMFSYFQCDFHYFQPSSKVFLANLQPLTCSLHF